MRGHVIAAVITIALVACAAKPDAAAPNAATAPSTPTTTTITTTAASTSATDVGSTATPASGPSAADSKRAVNKAFQSFKGVSEGKNADYIPALGKVDSKLYGVVLVTSNGEVYEMGDVGHRFSIQSVSKVFTLARLFEDIGPDAVEKKIGVDATGKPFNSILAIELDEKHRAGNPFVNPGAIAAVSLLPAPTAAARWSKIESTLEAFAGHGLEVDAQIYKSESDTNTRNRAISWLLKAYDVIPGDPMEALDLYTRQCSVSVSAHDLAVMGATLANGGINPMTRQRVVSPATASRTLSVMLTTGLYETTGTWSVDVGVPAKSGVGGGIVAVVPGRYAIGTFSPPLDGAGNSVRGQKAIASIVGELGGNLFMAQKAPAASKQAAPN